MPADPWPPVSVVLVAYAQERFVGEAVASVLAQDYPSCEIILSDDASADGTFAAMKAAAEPYRGPHRVRLNRNATRAGLRHVQAIFGLCSHDLIVVAHGDDVARPGRVRRQVEAMLDTGASMATSDAELIDEHGTSLGLFEGSGQSRDVSLTEMLRQGWERTMLGATFAYRRPVRAEFRPMTEGTPPSHDHILPARAALLSGVHFIGEPLIAYRRHGSNTGRYVADHTSTGPVLGETTQANGLASLGWLLGDFEERVRRGPPLPGGAAALTQASREALRRLDRLVDRRLELRGRGLEPGWIGHAEMALRDAPDTAARPAPLPAPRAPS